MPVCGKIFEKILFKSFYKYEDDYNILNGSKSGFCPGNSCVHLLLSVTNENWHNGLMFNLECLCIYEKYYELIHYFLNDRQQRVVLNGQYSGRSKIKAGVL